MPPMQIISQVQLKILAIEAAEFSVNNKVPMADSIIYILSRFYEATLWTSDVDLEPFEGVNYKKKHSHPIGK